MRAETRRAYEALKENGFTLVIADGERLISDTRRGVRPLLALYDGKEELRGCCAADKVVGKAAAYMYVLLGAAEVYAGVISAPALSVLCECGISAEYETLVPAIKNRAGTGLCPMETAVADAVSPDDALKKIRRKLEELSQKTGHS